MEQIKQILLEGKIPGLYYIKKFFLIVAVFAPITIIVYPNFRDLGQIGWIVLICVMSIRPVADIFPDLKILRTLVLLRREFGILAATLIISHFSVFFVKAGIPIYKGIFDLKYWNINSVCGWGFIGTAFALPALITSNRFSMMRLKKWWKPLQRLSYFFVLFGGVHIYLVGKFSGLVGIIVVSGLWLIAQMGLRIKFFRKQEIVN